MIANLDLSRKHSPCDDDADPLKRESTVDGKAKTSVGRTLADLGSSIDKALAKLVDALARHGRDGHDIH